MFSSPHEYRLLFLNYSIKKVEFNLATNTWLSEPLTGEFKEDYSVTNRNMATNKSTYINYKGNSDNSHYKLSA